MINAQIGIYMDAFTWICIYMDLRSLCLWEDFCAILCFAPHALGNFLQSYPGTWADLAVPSCTKGGDGGFSIFVLLRTEGKSD